MHEILGCFIISSQKLKIERRTLVCRWNPCWRISNSEYQVAKYCYHLRSSLVPSNHSMHFNIIYLLWQKNIIYLHQKKKKTLYIQIGFFILSHIFHSFSRVDLKGISAKTLILKMLNIHRKKSQNKRSKFCRRKIWHFLSLIIKFLYLFSWV